MEYRKLGNTNLEVSSVSMGCWGISGGQMWGKQDDKKAINAIKTARDKGINFFDTAEEYGAGKSEELLGEALSGTRQDVYVASKVTETNLYPVDLKRSCEASLKRLGTDYLDLYYIHWPNPDIPIEDTVAALQELKKEGKIRHFAPSNFGKCQLKEYEQYADLSINQLPYSLLWRAIEYEVLPFCLRREISLVTYSPLVHGLLTGKYKNPEEVPEGRARTRHFSSNRPNSRHGEEGTEEETFNTIETIERICKEAGINIVRVAIAWVLSRKGVATVMFGARTPGQVESNVEAIDLDVSADLLSKLTEASEDLKTSLGKNPDMWQAGENSRIM